MKPEKEIEKERKAITKLLGKLAKIPTPLYLRDLTPELQKAELDMWKAKGRTDLIKAHERGDDIAIGEYYTLSKVKRV